MQLAFPRILEVENKASLVESKLTHVVVMIPDSIATRRNKVEARVGITLMLKGQKSGTKVARLQITLSSLNNIKTALKA